MLFFHTHKHTQGEREEMTNNSVEEEDRIAWRGPSLLLISGGLQNFGAIPQQQLKSSPCLDDDDIGFIFLPAGSVCNY